MNIKGFLKEHSLTIALLAIMAIMMIASWPIGEASHKPEEHAYWKFWLSETLFSLEADVFGGLLLVWFTKFLIERGSKESKNSPKGDE